MLVSSASESVWFKAVGSVLPLVVTPIVTWLFSLRAASRRSAELDWLVRRVEVVERVDNLQRLAGSPGTYRQLVDAELKDVLEDLAALRAQQTAASSLAGGTEKFGKWRRWFLTYEQASMKGSVYKVLFYIFLAFSVTVVIPLSSVASDPTLALGHAERVLFALLGAGFYLVLALSFRAAAVRDYRKRLQKASSQGVAASIPARQGTDKRAA
jgi:hypothetical protein